MRMKALAPRADRGRGASCRLSMYVSFCRLVEVPLGDVTLNHFALRFSTATYDMKADLKLRYACDMRKGLASYPTGRYP